MYWNIPTILDKTFGALSHLHTICAFSNHPPSPLDSVGCYWPKTFEKTFKVYELQFCSGGGGGNQGIAELITVNWRSLTNFLPKTKVHSVCCRRKVKPQKQPDKKKGRRPRKVNKRGIRALTRPIDKVHIDNVDFTVKQLTVNAGISHLASRETFSRYLNENGFKFLQSRKKGLLSTKDRSLRLKIARKMRWKLTGRPDFWSKDVAFHLDGLSFVYKSNPLSTANQPKARVWRRQSEG